METLRKGSLDTTGTAKQGGDGTAWASRRKIRLVHRSSIALAIHHPQIRGRARKETRTGKPVKIACPKMGDGIASAILAQVPTRAKRLPVLVAGGMPSVLPAIPASRVFNGTASRIATIILVATGSRLRRSLSARLSR